MYITWFTVYNVYVNINIFIYIYFKHIVIIHIGDCHLPINQGRKLSRRPKIPPRMDQGQLRKKI